MDDLTNGLMALLTEDGSGTFSQLLDMSDRFCPFEAIGMVDQEIRHSNFLTFILDPNRPHPFSGTLLKAFLTVVLAASEEGQFPLSPIELHFLDTSSASVFRERGRIDMLFEIPFARDGKGLVVAVEIKIKAKESRTQLRDYQKYVESHYDTASWDRAFVFLTLPGELPSEKNRADWVPVAMGALIDRFDHQVEKFAGQHPAETLYQYYSSMVRRQHLDDEAFADVARKVWAKHGPVLDRLIEFRPDLKADIFEALEQRAKAICEKVNGATGLKMVPDTNSKRHKRFTLVEWLDINGFRQEGSTWVESKSLICIEVWDAGLSVIRVSYVIGPGPDATRMAVYDAVLARVDTGQLTLTRRTKTAGANWKHVHTKDILTGDAYAKLVDEDGSFDTSIDRIMKKLVESLSQSLPVFHDAVSEGLGHS